MYNTRDADAGSSLWRRAMGGGAPPRRRLSDAGSTVALAEAAAGSSIEAPPEAFRARSVLVSCERQLPAVLAMLQLDGVARRILLCPPDLDPAHVPGIVAEAEVDIIVSDGTGPAAQAMPGVPVLACGTIIRPSPPARDRDAATEWLLFTSGTTGRPKLVLHTLASLAGPLGDGLARPGDAVWSTFYDVRRYGGLQILLRALLGGASMVLSQAGEPLADFLQRAGSQGVTHMSGTPSHWRRVLMSQAATRIAPRYVRLSGEVADQAVLDGLKAAFPASEVAHAFASTEAGVAFDVRDGLAGFPAGYVGRPGTACDMRVEDGSLRVRSARTASRYLGDRGPLADADGFVDTGDMLELRGDRYHFVGRREGVINVGGQKVHPEEVEAVIHRHPAVQMARVRARFSPITGAVVVASVVTRPDRSTPFETLRAEILEICRGALPAHKVPALLTDVPALDIAPSGKLRRADA